ncbi:MAG: hypothetical protein KAS51_06755 [Candidatus Omnitrophica bacterium]|nr:hypothetical protein [Candidatus Omnitrophota bacterium]
MRTIGVEIEKNNKIHNLDVEGVFVEIGLILNSDFAMILIMNRQKVMGIDCYNGAVK